MDAAYGLLHHCQWLDSIIRMTQHPPPSIAGSTLSQCSHRKTPSLLVSLQYLIAVNCTYAVTNQLRDDFEASNNYWIGISFCVGTGSEHLSTNPGLMLPPVHLLAIANTYYLLVEVRKIYTLRWTIYTRYMPSWII
jgi:hypothetical protein